MYTSASVAQSTPPLSKVFVEGEELVYNVRYGFIDLGQVRIKIVSKEQTPTSLVYNGLADIQSYPKVPFVDLKAVFQSKMDTSVYSRQFIGKSKNGKFWEFAKYIFDYDAHHVLIEKGVADSLVEKRDTLEINVPYQDGLSLFYYARDQVFSGKKMNIPSLVKEEKVNTYIDFKNERSSVEIDPVDYPIDVVGFEGTAEFVGIFGLTGDFEGWFSADEARIPILAKMKVIIGNVTLELMEWKRPGWVPPRAND